MCRYRNLILALTRRLTDTHHDAEDLTQQAFMKAYINLSRFEQKSSFSTWVAVIARNEALMWRRKAASNRMVPIVDSNSDEPFAVATDFPDLRPNPENVYSQEESNRFLFSAMSRLKPEMREVLQLCELDEQSVADTAEQLGLTEAAVKSRRLRGR